MNYDDELKEYLKEQRNIIEVDKKIKELAIDRAADILQEMEFNLTIEMRALEITLATLAQDVSSQISDGDTLLLLALGIEDHLNNMTILYQAIQEKVKEAKGIEEV